MLEQRLRDDRRGVEEQHHRAARARDAAHRDAPGRLSAPPSPSPPRRSVAGLRPWRVASCKFADAAVAGDDWAGEPLPVRGVARLERDTARGAEALPPEAALLDVAALLDLVHEPPTDGD